MLSLCDAQAVAVGSFFTADAFLKAKFFEYGITFPSALGGMFLILGASLGLLHASAGTLSELRCVVELLL